MECIYARLAGQNVLPHKIEIANQLNALAFGEIKVINEDESGVKGFITQHSQDDDTARSLKEDIENIAEHLSRYSVNPPARPLVREIQKALVGKWIELEKANELWPPAKISAKEGVTAEKRAEILAKRRNLIKKPEGGLLAGALLMSCITILQANAKTVCRSFGGRVEENEVMGKAYDLFLSSLFKYEPDNRASFSTYVRIYLERALAKKVHSTLYPRNQVSLDNEEFGDDSSPKESLADPREAQPIVKVMDAEQRVQIKDIVDRFLSPRHREIIYLRFGLKDGVEHTLEETGEMLGGITREAVRSAQDKALRKVILNYQKIYGRDLDDFFSEYSGRPGRI